MATSPVKLQQGYGIGNALQNLSPFSIIANRVPTQSDKARIGTFWIYTGANNVYVLSSVTGGLSNWLTLSNGGAGVFSSLTVNGFITQTAGVTSLLATTTTGLTNNGVFNQTGNISVNACPVVGALSIIENGLDTVIYTQSNRLGGSRHLLCRQTSIDGSPVYFTTVKSRNGAIVNDTDILFQQNIVARGDTNESESARIVFTAGPPVLTTAQVPSSMAIVTTDLAGTGANRLTISTNGAINMPTQPCFSMVVAAASGGGVTGNNTFYPIGDTTYGTNPTAYTAIYQSVAGIVNASGAFVAPIAGRYLFTAGVRLSGTATATGIQLLIATTPRTIYGLENSCVASSSGFYSANTSGIVVLAALETARVLVQVVGQAADNCVVQGDNVNLLTYFTGTLLN
jgi:hypothetical protein